MKKTRPARADMVGVYVIGLDDPDRAAATGLAIDGMFKNSLAETLTETERAFQMSFVAMTDAIVVAIQIVSYVVIVIIMVVAANTMAMTARERIAEYATMKTLGFGALHIAGVVFGESIAIALARRPSGRGAVLPGAEPGSSSSLKQFFPVLRDLDENDHLDLLAAFVVGHGCRPVPDLARDHDQYCRTGFEG